MDSLNFVIMGKTGAGKSTLINAVLEEDLAPTGSGQTITKVNKLYSKNMFLPIGTYSTTDKTYKVVEKKVNLYDTVGLEIDKKITAATLEEVKRLLCRSKNESGNKDITTVWFCVNCRSNRFEPYELELIKELSIEYEIPFVIVITQCFSEDKSELELQIAKDLPEVTLVRILAKEYKLRGNSSVAPFGVQELIRKSVVEYDKNKVKILESKLEKLFLDKKTRVEELKARGKVCVEKYGNRAMKVGIVPAVCIPIIHGLCIKMLMDLNCIVGINSTKVFVSEIFSDAVLGVVATPFMGVPLISSGVAWAYVDTVGNTYLNVLMSVIERSSDSELKNNDLMSKRIREEIKGYKK